MTISSYISTNGHGFMLSQIRHNDETMISSNYSGVSLTPKCHITGN